VVGVVGTVENVFLVCMILTTEHLIVLPDVTEEDLETTEGETVDLYDKLIELAGWKPVDKGKIN